MYTNTLIISKMWLYQRYTGIRTHQANATRAEKPNQRCTKLICNIFASVNDRSWTRIGILLVDRFDTRQHIVGQFDVNTGYIAA